MTNAFDTPTRRVGHDWTADEIYTLTQLWAEGFTGSEIGRRMGITKSAAIGKVRRLRLTARPIPVHVRVATPPQRPAYAPPIIVDPRVAAEQRDARYREFAARPLERGHPCQFPQWGDERPTHEYCGQDRVAGKPYCATHCAVAYLTMLPPGQGSGQEG